jgi:eukaryotic translation initiation factor 2C
MQVPMKNSKQYPLIKATGDVGLGVATQNLVIRKSLLASGASESVLTAPLSAEKARNAKPQYYQNVALKVNVKLAGINQVVKDGILSGLAQKPTIIFGADVGHPGPGSQNPSIAALVGSHDLQGIQYATAVRVQNSREEIIMDLEDMAIGLLRKFFKSTKKKPERIIFYRDGISEGQYTEVCRREITAIKSEFFCFYPECVLVLIQVCYRLQRPAVRSRLLSTRPSHTSSAERDTTFASSLLRVMEEIVLETFELAQSSI